MRTADYNYIATRDPEELHEDTITCLSDLKFIVDENEFLSDLIKEHTLELLSGKMYEESKNIVAELLKEKEKLQLLIHEIEEHRNHLHIINSTESEKSNVEYKRMHYNLMIKVASFKAGFKNLKREVFSLIKKSMNASRQKRLLHKNSPPKHQLR